MNFYNNIHEYYCGIDLHARSLYVCILNQVGETVLHKEIQAKPKLLADLLNPYIGTISDSHNTDNYSQTQWEIPDKP